MYNALRSRLSLGSFGISRPTIPIKSVSQRDRAAQKSSRSEQRLDYMSTNRAILIAEVDEDGRERPVALAFIQANSDIAVCYLFSLAEPE